jgi:hypothetical protein
MLNKTQFVNIMSRIEKLSIIQDNVNHEGAPLGISVSMEEPIDIALGILESMFNDEEEWIDYYMTELHYGDKARIGELQAYRKDDTIIYLRTAGELYDWLIENMKNET